MPPPDDLSLEPVDHDPFAPGQFSPADIASMTHQAPDTSAKPAFDAAFGTLHAFLTGGLQGVANLRGANTPDWSKNLGAVLSSPEANAALGVMTPLGKGITAFHGSPHDFDAFDMSKIGTGEGAQAYGYGLYFAENEGTARSYRNMLSDQTLAAKRFGGAPFDKTDPAHIAAWYAHATPNADAALSELADMKEMGPEYQKAHDLLASGAPLPVVMEPGRMYQVSINADPEHFLDWDKPLSEQHPKVQEALRGIPGRPLTGDPVFDAPYRDRMSGQDFVRTLQNTAARESYAIKGPDGRYGPSSATTKDEAIAQAGGDPSRVRLVRNPDPSVATEQMRAAGIPGIKYLDQGSRAQAFKVDLSTSKGPYSSQTFPTMDAAKKYAADKEAEGFKTNVADQGTHNYVVFDDKLISIMKKYGIAGIGALPGLGAYHFQTDAVDHDPFAGQ